ncbi:7794_t:CDS:2 [Entrophospora sp. SA101]|nr:7794_t:CDS:2 [Entrophospora sp. SA101]
MKENQQKALRETDPIKKQALIAEIESDGKLLQQKYREHQEHSNKYRFNPAEKVRGMIDDPDNPFGNYGNNTYPDGNGSNHFPRQRKQGQPEQAYYFLAYVPEERNRAKEEIEEMFKQNFMVLPEKLDKTLWAEKENEKQLPEIQKALEEFAKKVENTPINDLSTVQQEANNFILEKRNKQAVYRIQFPPSLWNNLSEEQKELAKSNGHGELTLKDEVSGYKFSRLIED